MGLFDRIIGKKGKEEKRKKNGAVKLPPPVTSPEGMKVVASSRSEREELPPSDPEIKLVEESEKRIRYACGHEGAKTFAVSFFGEVRKPKFPWAERRKKCGACRVAELKPLLIRCCLCGFSIGPGEGVALYADGPEIAAAWKTLIGDGERKSAVGCMRWDCCPSGGFFAGYWTAEGFTSAFDGGVSAAGEALRTGKVVAGNV